MDHTWVVSALQQTDAEGVGALIAVAICQKCGLIRSVGFSVNEDAQLDLGGDCAAPTRPSRYATVGAKPT